MNISDIADKSNEPLRNKDAKNEINFTTKVQNLAHRFTLKEEQRKFYVQSMKPIKEPVEEEEEEAGILKAII